MRLADTPGLARAGGTADPAAAADEDPAGGAASAFAAAVAALTEGKKDAVAAVRDDLAFEECPAPKRLAPQAVALAATAYRDGIEIAAPPG